jgi:hypothetical protein
MASVSKGEGGHLTMRAAVSKDEAIRGPHASRRRASQAAPALRGSSA